MKSTLHAHTGDHHKGTLVLCPDHLISHWQQEAAGLRDVGGKPALQVRVYNYEADTSGSFAPPSTNATVVLLSFTKARHDPPISLVMSNDACLADTLSVLRRLPGNWYTIAGKIGRGKSIACQSSGTGFDSFFGMSARKRVLAPPCCAHP